MRVFVDTFWIPKGGNQFNEWEDAFSPELTTDEQEREQFRLAISDGASFGMLSGEWARILTQTFCHASMPVADMYAFLEKASTQWKVWVQEYLEARAEQNRPIKWYEEPGLKAGAFATFLGLELTSNLISGRWQAIAVGDSCLFQVRQDRLIVSFPIQHSTEFNNTPALICSLSPHNDRLDDKITGIGGSLQVDDELYLMTDALAQWFLSAYEMDQRPWQVLRDLNTADQLQTFEELAEHLRQAQVMRNDDVTLVRITVA